MFPVEEGFVAALRGEAAQQVLILEILERGTVVAATGPLQPNVDVAVISASASMSRRGLVTRQTSTSLVDLTGVLVPVASSDLLDSRSGHEVRLHAGYRTAAGTFTAPVATVGIEDSAVTGFNGAAVISVSGRDRMATLAEAGWPSTYNVASGTPFNQFARDVLAMFLPHVTAVLADTDHVLPAMTLGGSTGNPAFGLAQAAQSAGMEVQFSGAGMLTTRPWPNPATSPVVWEYARDRFDLLEWPERRRVDRRSARNGVRLTGSATWLVTHVQGEAWQTDRTKPLWHDPVLWNSPNRPADMSPPMPEEIENAQVGSNAQAQAVAEAKLPDVLGADEIGEFTGIPNYAHEPGDVIAVESDIFGGKARTVIDDIALNLDVGGRMDLTTRRRVLT